MKDENYYVVQGWMINKKKLKGNELLIYAIINGFSQDDQGEFTGSLSYLCSCTGMSKRTAMNTLQSLVDKKLIIKKSETKNSITFNRYKISNYTPGAKIAPPPGVESAPPPGAKIAPNNIGLDNNNYINKHIDSDFEKFYSEYPRKIGKQAAKKAYEKASKHKSDFPDIDTMIDILKTWIRGSEFPSDTKFVPYPSTWLNQKRWLDFQDQIKPKNQPAGDKREEEYPGQREEEERKKEMLERCHQEDEEKKREFREAALNNPDNPFVQKLKDLKAAGQ